MVEVRIKLSRVLANTVNNQGETWTEGDTLGEVLNSLVQRFGGKFKRIIFDDNGEPRSFINIYVNGKDMRFIEGLETKLKKNDEILTLPAVSGG